MTLSELKARVGAAVGADRELDFFLAALCFDWPVEQRGTDFYVDGRRAAYIDPGKRNRWFTLLPDWRAVEPYTSSLDAALGLVEAKLPGCDWRVELDRETQPSAPYSAWVDPNDGVSGPLCEQGSSPSLALLSALLAALMAEEVMA